MLCWGDAGDAGRRGIFTHTHSAYMLDKCPNACGSTEDKPPLAKEEASAALVKEELPQAKEEAAPVKDYINANT